MTFPTLFAAARTNLGPFNACPAYSWSMHLLLLLPLALTVGVVGFMDGWWGESVRLTYEVARHARPGLTTFLHLITSWGSPLLYVVYLALLVSGLKGWNRGPDIAAPNRARNDIRLTLRYIVISLLVTLLITQMIKYGLGMPRPGSPWPPRYLGFNMSYNSFPSGHTTEIVASALPLAFRFRNKPAYVALALLVALVGYSRIWLGRHHPVDILAGMVLGSLAARLICCCPIESGRS